MMIKPIGKNEVITLKQAFYNQAVAPLDDFWTLAIVETGEHFGIYDGKLIGYYILKDQVLVQFFLEVAYQPNARAIFKKIIDEQKIKSAYTFTYHPDYLSLCLDISIKTTIDGILYEDVIDVRIDQPIERLIEKKATLDDLKDAIAYTTENMAGPYDWLEVYYKNLIKIKGLFLYYLEDQIIGTGEIRIMTDIPGVANVGMTVHNAYKKQSIGLYILTQLKQKAYAADIKPICGTDLTNLASQKTIQKAGFRPYHRVLLTQFE